MKTRNINKAKQFLKEKNNKIVITTHVNPDGDAIGSCLGLYEFLKVSGYKNVVVVSPNDYASFLKWMPGTDKIIIAERDNSKAAVVFSEADIIFCLDFNDIERTENLKKFLEKSKAKTILVDHHPQPSDSFDLVFSYTNTSSTAELIYNFIERLEGIDLLNQKIAACLFVGIMTDTGSFSYACNYPETFEICAELIKTGINVESIHRSVYNTYSLSRMNLLGYCLNQKLCVLPDHNVAYIYLSQEDLNRFNHKEGDTEGVVNYCLSINNINIAALFIEKEDHVKVSFRSVGDIDVNDFARRFFNGGGHANAAGGKYYKDLPDTIEYFESVIAEFCKCSCLSSHKLKQ